MLCVCCVCDVHVHHKKHSAGQTGEQQQICKVSAVEVSNGFFSIDKKHRAASLANRREKTIKMALCVCCVCAENAVE